MPLLVHVACFVSFIREVSDSKWSLLWKLVDTSQKATPTTKTLKIHLPAIVSLESVKCTLHCEPDNVWHKLVTYLVRLYHMVLQLLKRKLSSDVIISVMCSRLRHGFGNRYLSTVWHDLHTILWLLIDWGNLKINITYIHWTIVFYPQPAKHHAIFV